MNENKSSPRLQRAGGGGGGVHDSEGGLPFKGAVPSPPLCAGKTGRTWGSGTQAGPGRGLMRILGYAYPGAHTSTQTRTSARTHPHRRAPPLPGPARPRPCPVSGRTATPPQESLTPTQIKKLLALQGVAQKPPRIHLSSGGVPQKDARATASSL